LIAKRRDKLLDHVAVASKASKPELVEVGKAQLQHRPLQITQLEHLRKCEYEALNTQLITELPVLTRKGYDVLDMCTQAYVLLEQDAVRIMHEALQRELQPVCVVYVSPSTCIHLRR
jgi:hypothetical protein